MQQLHINCDQAVRQESEDLRRAGGVVQRTLEDFNNKNKTFFERLPQYLAADQIDFYYRPKLDQVACVVSRIDGKVVVMDAVGFKAVRQLHEGFAPGIFDFCLPT